MNAFSRNCFQSAVATLFIMLFTGMALASPFWAQVPGINLTTQNLDWENVASGSYSVPAVAALVSFGLPTTNKIHVFYRDKTKCVQHLYGTDRGQDLTQGSAVPKPCDDDMDGDMSAIAWDNSGRIDIFWFNGFTGPRALMHRWTDGTKWYKETLAQTATTPDSTPTVASWGKGHLDVFWKDTNNNIRWLGFESSQKGKTGYTSKGWFKTERVAATNVTGTPTAVERTTNIIDLFWKDSNGMLNHKYTNNGGTAWSGNQSLGVTASTPPSATSWGKKRIDVVYGVDANHLGHLWIDGGTGSWSPNHETLYSSKAIGTPFAVAATTHSGRMDVFAVDSSWKINHTLYQESLPGFLGVGEGTNGGEGIWCADSAAVSVINYVANPNPKLLTCDGVNMQKGLTTCCQTPTAPAACLTGGNAEPILDGYNISYNNLQPLPLDSLKMKLWQERQSIISHHAHPADGGHCVVLTDTYRLHGEDMVVIFGTQFNANWVLQYSEYLKNHFGTDPQTGLPNGWKVDGMITNFVKK